MKTRRPGDKITVLEQLQDLIDHPDTSDAERESARRMLARKLAAPDIDSARAASAWTGWTPPHGWTGHKYDPNRSIADIAALMRADIAALRTIARAKAAPGTVTAPDAIVTALAAGINVTVRKSWSTYTPSIDLTMRRVPRDWWLRVPDEHRPHVEIWYPGKQLTEAANGLHVDVWEPYGYNRSDAMTDYSNVRYYGGVDVIDPDAHRITLGGFCWRDPDTWRRHETSPT